MLSYTHEIKLNKTEKTKEQRKGKGKRQRREAE
jgi:hypothetical protein